MEDMMNEVVETGLETALETNDRGNLGGIVLGAGLATTGYLLYTRVVKPIARKMVAKINEKIAEKRRTETEPTGIIEDSEATVE